MGEEGGDAVENEKKSFLLAHAFFSPRQSGARRIFWGKKPFLGHLYFLRARWGAFPGLVGGFSFRLFGRVVLGDPRVFHTLYRYPDPQPRFCPVGPQPPAARFWPHAHFLTPNTAWQGIAGQPAAGRRRGARPPRVPCKRFGELCLARYSS